MAVLAWLSCPTRPALGQNTAAELWKQGAGAYQAGDIPRATRLIEQALDAAIRERNPAVEADARFALALRLRKNAQFEASNVHLRAALTLFQQSGDRTREAAIWRNLGANATGAGNRPEARADFQKALALYEALGAWREAAAVRHDLTFVTEGAEWLENLKTGLELARRTGARAIEAALLHSWADSEFAADDFDAAFDRLNEARAILEDLKDRSALANVLTSLGRLYRVHGHPEEALRYYQRALELHREAGEALGTIQSLNATSVALNHLGRFADAARAQQEALELARQSGTPRLIKAMLEGIASSRLYARRPAQAAEALEEARRLPPPREATLTLLSQARFALGQYEAALEAADGAVAIADGSEARRNASSVRAQALWKLGRTAEALNEVRQLMDSVEKARARLVPSDFMKQGFADTDREMTNLSIQVMLESGQHGEAMEAAERARGRAFLDLLATKNVVPRSAAADEGESGARPPSDAVTLRDAVAAARRLDATVVSYWVDEATTTIWIVSPDGRFSHARTAFGAAALEKWIDGALGAGSGRARAAAPIRTRGGDTTLASSGDRRAWRALYDALIRPVRSNLPQKPGSRLTIIPSGPLFRLSFAALKDEKGRYLIETYALNYSPAIDVFRYTRAAQMRAAERPVRYLLVANPAGMPKADGKTLPPLPGTEKEALAISRLAPAGAAVVLEGKAASERAVREAIRDAKVIHLATHGVIDNVNPLHSFVALGRSGDESGANGRLTAEEVYGLDLRADLVVLSACRSGLGRISGDGVTGLARAFLYAGAASVVSTLWDVADQPAATLLESFYRAFLKGNGRSDALREAQLRLMRSLRRGDVRVDTPFGALALPEDPLLWAGYELVGEP